MKKLIYTFMAGALLMAACGNGQQTEQSYSNHTEICPVKVDSLGYLAEEQCRLIGTDYITLEVEDALNVVMHDSVQRPRVVAERQKDIDMLHISLEGGTLNISREGNGFSKGITLYLPLCPTLSTVEVEDASTFSGTLLASGRVRLEADGASRLQATLANKVESVSVESEGASKVIARGEAERLTVEADGNSHANMSDLRVRTAEVDLEGAGCSKVNASERISGSVDGASHLMYLGNPALSVKQDGASRVNQIAEGDKYKQF